MVSEMMYSSMRVCKISPVTFTNARYRAAGSGTLAHCYKTKPVTAFSPSLSNLGFRSNSALVLMSPLSNYRSYSSSFSSKANQAGDPGVQAASAASGVDVSDSGVVGSDCADKVTEEQFPLFHMRKVFGVLWRIYCAILLPSGGKRTAKNFELVFFVVWLLLQWKTNVFTLALPAQFFVGLDAEKLLIHPRFSTLSLFVIMSMALAEACGVAVQYIRIFGCIRISTFDIRF